jgi:hypothetical protein
MKFSSITRLSCLLPLALCLVSCGDNRTQNGKADSITHNKDPADAAKRFVSNGVVTIPGANVALNLSDMCTAEAKLPHTTLLRENWSGALHPDVSIKDASSKKGGYLSVWSTGKKIEPNELEQFVNEWKEARPAVVGRVHEIEKWTNSRSTEFVVATLDGYGLPYPVKHYHFVNSQGFVCFVYARVDTAESHPLLRETIDSLVVLDEG